MSLHGLVAYITFNGALASGGACFFYVSPPSTPWCAWRGGVARVTVRRCMDQPPLSPVQSVDDCLLCLLHRFPIHPPACWAGWRRLSC